MTLFTRIIQSEPVKRYKKNTLFAIPFFFTFANAILGLLSVVKALDSEFITAAYCILLAIFMDTLDGRLARAFGSTSVLGMELDSLCDAISFCLAPVVLLYSWEVQDFGMFGFIVLAIYLCAGLFRLAKFNINSSKNGNWFLGLPTPVSAFLLSSFVLTQNWVEDSFINFLFKKNVLFALLLLISFLMISKIKFPAFKQHKGIILYAQLLIFFLTGLLGYLQSPYMLLTPLLYILFGFSCCFYSNTKRFLASKF